MAAISILNDKVTSIPLAFENYLGSSVSPISGDSYTVVSSSASLGATVGVISGSPVLILTPMVQAGTGYTVTVSDAKGLPSLVVTFNITPDPALATQMALTTGSLSMVAQAIPAAPGP
jgi:hypothetical protein